MLFQEVIKRKRDGQALTRAEIEFFVYGVTDGSLPDYQISALLMAIQIRGMNRAETGWLTLAMRDSGERLNFDALPGRRPIVGKHSSGGVGDKVSLVLVPLMAELGIWMPKLSGRGLGHTGGTIDKLEAIPGMRTEISLDVLNDLLVQLGCAMIGQSADIAPADKKLYALRDVTGSVESLPLIASSIMSKKLAEGIDSLVLDVKAGSGALMKTAVEAKRLAQAMVGIGKELGKPVVAVLTDMNQPLGRAVGNALEVREALACLRGERTAEGGDINDLWEVVLETGSWMLQLAGIDKKLPAGRQRIRKALESGVALKRFAHMVAAQGGDAAAIENPSRIAVGPVVTPLLAKRSGYLHATDCEAIGLAAIELGAGRARKEDTIDPQVGLILRKKIGDRITKGEAIVDIYHQAEAATGGVLDAVKNRLAAALVIKPAKKRPPRKILGFVR